MDSMMQKMYYLRDEIANAALAIGERNEKVVFVSANVMSSCRILSAKERFPGRTFEVGIAEQTMISFAAGIAREGYKVYAFTMAPFMSMRACEQVRTDVAYNKQDVVMIAPYAGVSGGISGATHWAIEDCAIMSGIPGIIILEPSDPIQAKKMLEATDHSHTPIYIRVGIEGVPQIYDENYDYEIGKASIVSEGEDGAFICAGVTVKFAIEAAKVLYEKFGKKVMVIDMHTIKPIDKKAVMKAMDTGRIVVAQDHNIVGGLGSMISSVIAESGKGVQYKVCGIPDAFITMAHAPHLYSKYGLDASGLIEEMSKMMGISI